MKIIFIILLYFSFFTNIIAQETILKVEKFDDTKQISKEYYVLKSNSKIKHGLYISYIKLDKTQLKSLKKGQIEISDYILEKGNYIKGLKEGEWIENSLNTTVKGQYVNNLRTGIWETYKDNVKINSYNYNTEKPIDYEIKIQEKGKVIQYIDKNTKKIEKVEFKPEVEYPESALENEIEGLVIVIFNVHEDCSIDNFQIEKSLSEDCDKSALKAVSDMSELFKKYAINCKEGIQKMPINFILLK